MAARRPVTGVCGTFNLYKGTLTYNPFIAIAFNVAGEDSTGNEITAADASAWGGLCIAYSSTENAMLELIGDLDTGDYFPYFPLPKSEEGTVKCTEWIGFSKAGDPEGLVDSVVKNLVTVRFKIQGLTGTEGKFNVMSIGSYVEQ